MDTRKIHRLAAKARRLVIECERGLDGRATCRVVESAKKCGPSCSCGPCSKREASKKKPFHGDARLAERAGRILGASLGKAKRLLDRTSEVGDQKFPQPTDAWQTSEAVKAFEASAGDGMEPTGGITAELPESSDGRLDPEEVNYRFAQDQSRSCATCRHFQPTAPEEYGGSCELVVGMIRGVDTCNAWEAKAEPEATFDKEYQN